MCQEIIRHQQEEMKPSQRIDNLILKKVPVKEDGSKEWDITYVDMAIIEYLDEEKERINEILHEIVSTMYDGSTGDTNQINYLHQMIDEKLVEPSTLD